MMASRPQLLRMWRPRLPNSKQLMRLLMSGFKVFKVIVIGWKQLLSLALLAKGVESASANECPHVELAVHRVLADPTPGTS